MKTLTALVTILSLGLASTSFALSGRDVAEKVDDVAKMSTESAFTRFTLSTCKFGIKEKRLLCVEEPRIKSVESISLNVGETGDDTKSLAIVLEPTSERGIGMLNYVYDDETKDNETWLYLSALGKVKRIAAGNSDDESEPANLFGSEITTEDQETGKLDDYTYRILKAETFQGRPVYILESTPTAERAKKSRYAKSISWVDSERFVTLKVQMYDKRGKAVKRIQMSNIEQIDGVWIASSVTVMNLVTSRLTNMNMDAITFGIEIDEAFLTQRALTDNAFREQHLTALRAQTN